MRLWFRRSILVLVLLGASPVSASAQFIDFIDWIERLSGPGFWGHAVDIPVVCIQQDGGVQSPDCLPVDARGRRLQDEDRQLVIGVRVGAYFSGVTGGYYRSSNGLTYPNGLSDSDKDIEVVLLGPFANWTVHPALDVVAAIELNRFSGPRIREAAEPFWAASIQPSIVWRPIAHFKDSRRARAVGLVLGFKQYLKTLDPAKFGAVSGFESGKEGVLRLALRLDWLTLLKR